MLYLCSPFVDVCRGLQWHRHTWHVHGCHCSRGHHDKGAHHVVVLVFQQVTVVHEAPCEAIEGSGNRDKLTRVHPHGVFPAHFVLIERSMLLKKDRCSRSSRFWIEAVLIVEVSAERLELDEVYMEGMGICRQVDDTPYFCRTIGDEPVDGILKLPGDGAILHCFPLLVCQRNQCSSGGGFSFLHLGELT